jgi:putative membrane protein
MKKSFAGAVVIAAFVFACNKDKDNKNSLNSTDQMFVTQVAIGNNAEVAAGQLAATKASNDGVKAFGQMMATEHGAAQTELKTVGSSAGISVSDSVDAEHVALMARLNSLSGHSFDTAYINSQVKDHQKTLGIFQTELTLGNHQQVKAYASKYLPHIQMHLQKADSLSQAIQ